ncbi:rod shape-determining protein MreC [Treponema bryantii]|uniref:Cell shape-determining protein MreC n=1 Tax=Treponema bryantii TaxID=163 RepID=A0A1H9ANX9_9SPIR|nr:rod shape-determining protein MreC [Treponema bryantii]BDC93566.1 cell shape-determining protein MreC [Treponema bryantii]SEP78369.1 rod shape-determining protein MreC [Treponema bryantii]
MRRKPNFSFKIKFAEFLLVLYLLAGGLSLAFHTGGFILNFKQIGFSVFSSLDKGVHFVAGGFKNTFNAVGELRKLKKDYNDLVIKLENYEEMQRSNADIRKENARLKEQLDFAVSLDEKNIPAQIIARDLDNAFTYLTIDKGSVNGIRKNMPVIAFQNGNQGLVGKVVQVGTFTSQIMPIYNINNIVSARIQNTRDLGLVNGLGSQDQPLLMQYIRKSVVDELSYGDIVVTSGENDNYMRDIAIGTITKITTLDYNSSLNIELVPIIDFARLENVVVVNQKELNDRKADKE